MKTNIHTYILLGLSLIFFIACGNGGKDTKSVAIDKIVAYAQNSGPAPTLQDYLDAGVVGIVNVKDINEVVKSLTQEEVDTQEELQTIADDLSVTIAPTAVATVSKKVGTVGQNIRLSGDKSTDSDGSIVSYEWKEGNKVLFTISTFDKSDFSVGKHTLTLTVTDDDGLSSTTTLSFTINATVPPNTTVSSNTITHNGTTYGFVTSPYTGKIWLDRNLGASKVCSSPSDSACYGDYYQWGRNADGHENSGSSISYAQATNLTTVGHGNFILIADADDNDWAQTIDNTGIARSTNWSKTDGSSICPIGFRVPTFDELERETINASDVTESTTITNQATAFSNFLKLPSAGYRDYSTGSIVFIKDTVGIWTSTVVYGSESIALYFLNRNADWSNSVRTQGLTLRCVKG